MRGVLSALFIGLTGVLGVAACPSLGGAISKTDKRFLAGVGGLNSIEIGLGGFGVSNREIGRGDFIGVILLSFLKSRSEAEACNDEVDNFSFALVLCGRGSNEGAINSCIDTEAEELGFVTRCFFVVANDSCYVTRPNLLVQHVP